MDYLDHEQGDDPELLEARERMPEPSRYDGLHIRVALPRREPFNFRLEPLQTVACLRTATFEKVEVVTEHRGCFGAWRHVGSGKLYI